MSTLATDFANAKIKISNMVERLHLPSPRRCEDNANQLLDCVYEKEKFKNSYPDVLATACLYIIIRQEGILRPFNVLGAASELKTNEISRYYRMILEEMDITLNPITHSHYNRVFCIFLGLPAIVQRAALNIGSKAEELDIVPGCSAVSVAAAAIYMASNASDKKLTKKEVCDVTCGVKEFTIGKSYELMYPRAAELFPVDFELDINKLPKS